MDNKLSIREGQVSIFQVNVSVLGYKIPRLTATISVSVHAEPVEAHPQFDKLRVTGKATNKNQLEVIFLTMSLFVLLEYAKNMQKIVDKSLWGGVFCGV